MDPDDVLPMRPMRVLFAASEMAPWVKTGGLGDVAGALPDALAAAGCDVRVLLPAYPRLMQALPQRSLVAHVDRLGGALPPARLWRAHLPGGLQVLLLDAESLYARDGNPYLGPDGRDWPDNGMRFGLLARVAALLSSGDSPLTWRPQVLHCNDWQTGLAPAFLHFLHPGRAAASVMTVHNLSFTGSFDAALMTDLGLPWHAFRFDAVEFHGRLSFLKAGLQLADRITTVSPTYADEILRPEFGCGLEGLLRHRRDRLSGILNGIDTVVWDPARDPALEVCYDAATLARKREGRAALQRALGLAAQDTAPLLGVISRLTEQKGLDLLLQAADRLLSQRMQLAVLGSGEAWMEQGFRDLAARHPGACAVRIGFDETLAHRIEAGADLFVMPSRFEPCGLNQMYSLRYGTPPIVRRTGGLADTVVDASGPPLHDGTANGFVFDAPSADALAGTVERAAALWRDRPRFEALQRAGMRADFGWHVAARRYLAVYRAAASPADAD